MYLSILLSAPTLPENMGVRSLRESQRAYLIPLAPQLPVVLPGYNRGGECLKLNRR